MNKLEIRRKVIHLLLGVILVSLIYYGFIDSFSLGLITIIAFLILIFARKIKIHFIEWCLDKFERPEDRKKFPGKGPLFFLIGSELSLIFFSKDIAMASIIILTIGDSIPNIVGMYYKRVKHPFSDKKFLEGAVAGIILSAIAAHIFVRWYEALIAAAVAIFLEGIDMKNIDDNLTIPLVAGIVITLIRWVV